MTNKFNRWGGSCPGDMVTVDQYTPLWSRPPRLGQSSSLRLYALERANDGSDPPLLYTVVAVQGPKDREVGLVTLMWNGTLFCCWPHCYHVVHRNGPSR